MNLFPIQPGRFDFSGSLENVYKIALQTKTDFLKAGPQSDLCLEEYRKQLSPGVFLMPIFLNWKCRLRTGTWEDLNLLSTGLKKEMRRALRYAKKQGLSCFAESPLKVDSFEKFRGFYARVMKEKGYEALLKMEYYQRHLPENLYLFSLLGSDGELLGGMLVDRLSRYKLSTHFKAAVNDKCGFNDLLLENALYELAGKLGIKTLYYGKDFNLRGLENRKPSLFFYKLRWGFTPFVSWNLPTAYVDLSFLKDRQFTYVFFVSAENRPGMVKQSDFRLVMNFVLGESNLEDLKSSLDYLKKNTDYGVRVYDTGWNVLFSQ
jgi:hypothetical protein